jgi:HSP20 family protein
LIQINEDLSAPIKLGFYNAMKERSMAEAATKLPIKAETHEPQKTAAPKVWNPFEKLRRDVDRLFQAFDGGVFNRPMFDVAPFWRNETWDVAPAVNIAENDKAYEITAELPGMDEKNVDVSIANGGLTIKGEKREEKEEKNKGYHLQERSFGTFERYFRVPEGVDSDKIEATFKKGVLTVVLPKTAEAQRAAKKIAVKVA